MLMTVLTVCRLHTTKHLDSSLEMFAVMNLFRFIHLINSHRQLSINIERYCSLIALLIMLLFFFYIYTFKVKWKNCANSIVAFTSQRLFVEM